MFCYVRCPSQWFVIWRCFVLCLVSFSGVSLFSPNRLDAAHSVSVAHMYQVLIVLFCLSRDQFVRGVVPLFFVWLCSQCIYMRWFRARPRSKQPLCVIILSVCYASYLNYLPYPFMYSHVLSDLLSFSMMSDASLNAKKLKIRKCCLMFWVLFYLWFVDSLFLLLIPACTVLVSFRTCSPSDGSPRWYIPRFCFAFRHFLTSSNDYMFYHFPWFDF